MSAPTSIRRTLGRFEVTCLGINAIVGAGIFALPDDLFRNMGGASPLVFLLCALGLLPVGWCYAEAARSAERSGGPYVYVRQAFGPLSGYVVGWMCLVNSIFSFAAVARVAAAYVARVVGGVSGLGEGRAARDRGGHRGGVLCAQCARGEARRAHRRRLHHRQAGRPGGARDPRRSRALPRRASPSRRRTARPVSAPRSSSRSSRCRASRSTPVPAGETQEARRVMPFAILASLIGASLVFVLVQTIVVGAYPGLAATSDTPLADAAMTIGPRIGRIVVWGGVISTLGFVAGNAFGTPRYAFAMAEDGYLPRALAYVDPRRGAPLGAIAATGILAAILAATVVGGVLFALSNLAVAVQYLGTCLAIGKSAFVDRQATKRRRALRGLIALGGAAVSVWIMLQGVASERRTAALAVGLGLLVGLLSKRAGRIARA